MADNTTLNSGTGGDTIRDLARLAGTVKTQVVQLDMGGASANAEVLVTAGQQVAAASMPVVLASDKTPNVNIASTSTTQAAVLQTLSAAIADTPGTITVTSGTGQAIAAVGTSGNATFHVVTSAFVGTLIFEASLNGGANYAPIICIREDGSGAETTAAINTAVAFIRTYTVGLPGFSHFRVRCSAFTSGTAAIYIAQGPILIEPNPTLAAGTATIGSVKLTDGTNTAAMSPTGQQIVQQRGADLLVSGIGTAATAFTTTLAAPGAGLFHYITAIEIIRVNATATAVAAAATLISITTTNLPGSLAWSMGNAIAAGAYDVPVRLTPNNPIRSSVANTATTIVCPSGGTGVQFRVNVYYYTST
jgi:hypothetical protein